MLNINDVKAYIRATDEDDSVVTYCMESARSYLQDAIDDFDTKYANADAAWQTKADLTAMQLCSWCYENRGEVSVDIPASVRLMIYQLQLKAVSV